MTIVFLADFFKEDLLGGAESNDSVLLDHLGRLGHTIEKVKCQSFDTNHLKKNKIFIVSNFVSLSESAKASLRHEKYIIYEHDHKYLKSRNPGLYKNFVVPQHAVVNASFYHSAHAVVVLSDVCKRIIERTLNLTNVHNIGCSLWSDEKLDFIKTLCNQEKNDKFAVIQSSNPIKSTPEAVQYCQKNNLDYEVIGPCDERTLLEKLSQFKALVFFPKVLETFSRISMEAKFLKCKLVTKPRLLGAASESVFDLSGEEAIEAIRKRRDKALKLFDALISSDPQEEDITVILNCYRRTEYLEEQVKAIRAQTTPASQIWLWVNYHEDNEKYDFSKLDVDRVFKNDYNWKYYGRFAAGMLADTTYVALFDDDTIPGTKWFENCLETMQATPGILGGAGVILQGNRYQGHTRYGWSSQNKHTIEVDLVGHAWFFKQEWLKYLWMEKPYTWENGEDIQFSYCCQKYGNVKTYCPPHPKEDPEVFSSLKGYKYGVDEKASSHARNHAIFYQQRDDCVANAIQNGWKTVLQPA